MSTLEKVNAQHHAQLRGGQWIQLSLVTAVVSVVGVLAVQTLAISEWPEIALFAPLSNYMRAALFTVIPVFVATILFAWLVSRQRRPVQRFITIAVIVLLISIIPDYVLPDPNRTILASTVTASLHVVAAVITLVLLIGGYERRLR